MLRELFDRIVEMATEAHRIERLPIDDPRNVRLRIGENVHTFELPTPNHTGTRVETPADLFAAIRTYATGKTSSVWHNENQIIAVLDDDDRREQITIALQATDTVKTILKLPRAFEPKALCLFIKRDLAGAIDPTAADPFRSIDFSRRDDVSVRTTKDAESLGREVHARVGGDLPEYLDLTVRWYANPSIHARAVVRVSVDADATNGTIHLTPLGGQLDEAVARVQQDLHKQLEQLADQHQKTHGDVVHVFHGSPIFA